MRPPSALLAIVLSVCALENTGCSVPSEFRDGAKLRLDGFGEIRWISASKPAKGDSLRVSGRWTPVGAKDSTAAREALAVLDSSGRLVRLEIGPFDSLVVSGGTIRSVGLRKFDLVGTDRSLRLVPSPKRSEVVHRLDGRGSDSLNAEIRLGGRPWIWSDDHRYRSVGSIAFSPSAQAVFDTALAPILSRGRSGITFSVDEVQPNLERLPPLSDSDWRESRRLLFDATSEWVVGEHDGVLVESRDKHAFANAFVRAWNEHRPVRLSPDAVWMVLLEGMVRRVRDKPEACRSEMVLGKSGKDTLETLVPRTFRASIGKPRAWDALAEGFLDSMDRHVVGSRHRVLTRGYSTTTRSRALATRFRVMELYQSYFTYRTYVGCGIPWISLEGTPEDWKSLRHRLDTIGVCGLAPWTARMAPILDEFVRASEGRPSLDFWRSFVRYTPANPDCGETSHVDGWITEFFASSPSIDGQPRRLASLEFDIVPEDHGSFPLRIALDGRHLEEFAVVSGFAGIAQGTDGALSPELGWCVWKPVPESPPAKDAEDDTGPAR